MPKLFFPRSKELPWRDFLPLVSQTLPVGTWTRWLCAATERLGNDRMSGSTLPFRHLFHHQANVTACGIQHRGANRMNFSHDWVDKDARHYRRIPRE